VLLLSGDKVGQPSPRDVCHHEAFSLFTRQHTFTLSHVALYVRRSILPLNVFEREWAIQGYLYHVSVTLQNCPVPLNVPSLICSNPRSAVPFTRFYLPGRICTVSKIRGDIYIRRPALFSPAMAVSKIYFHAITPTVWQHRTHGAHTLCFVPICAPRNTRVFHTHGRKQRSPCNHTAKNQRCIAQQGHSKTQRKALPGRNDRSKYRTPLPPSVGRIPETLEFEFSRLAMAWASTGRMPCVHGLAGRVVRPTRWASSRATTGPEHVSGTVPRWPPVRMGGQGLVGQGGKMSAKKDGPDTMGPISLDSR
jgi:hypothetical protein